MPLSKELEQFSGPDCNWVLKPTAELAALVALRISSAFGHSLAPSAVRPSPNGDVTLVWSDDEVGSVTVTVPEEGPCRCSGDNLSMYYTWQEEFGELDPVPEILLEELRPFAEYPGGMFAEWYGGTSAT